jgi:hypothetical protein
MGNRQQRRLQAKELGLKKRYNKEVSDLVHYSRDLHKHKGKFLKEYAIKFFRTYILGSSLSMFDTGYELLKLFLNVLVFIVLFTLNFVKWCLVIVFVLPIFVWFMIRAYIKIGRVAKEKLPDDNN